MTTKVLIVDDHPAVREGLAVRIASQPNMEVCGYAATTAEAVSLLQTAQPDVAVVDIQLEGGSGLELIKRIKAHNESIGVLVWSMHPDHVYAQRAISAGALGYINKRHATSQIIEAIRRVSEGRIYLCKETAEKLLGAAVGRGRQFSACGLESLSDRELEIFRLIGEGLTTSEIGKRLHRSVNTVEAHRQKIKSKLGLKNAPDLTRAAIQWVLEAD